jgi:hypothetical protein
MTERDDFSTSVIAADPQARPAQEYVGARAQGNQLSQLQLAASISIRHSVPTVTAVENMPPKARASGLARYRLTDDSAAPNRLRALISPTSSRLQARESKTAPARPALGPFSFEEVHPGSAGWRAMEADCGLINFRVTVLSQAGVRFATAPET